MRKLLILAMAVVLVAIGFYTDKVIEYEYNVSIFEYFSLIRDYTDEERAILKSNEPLIYAGNNNEAPLGIYSESGQSLGLVVDYVNALSIELGINMISKPMVWHDVLDSLNKGDSDVSDMVPSDKRRLSLVFTNPIYNINGSVLVATENQSVFSVDDLNYKRVAIQRGDHAIDILDAKNMHIEYVYTDNIVEALVLLYDNDVDAVVGDEPAILYNIRELKNSNDYILIEEYVYESVASLAMPIENEALIGIFNKAIFNLKRKGIIDNINKKWMAVSSTFFDDKIEEKLKLRILITIFFLIMLVIISLVWFRSLNVLVKIRTKELELTKNELEITFDGMSDFIIIFDTSYRIINMNKPFLEFLKGKKRDFIDISVYEVPITKAYFERENMNDHKSLEFKYGKKIYEGQITYIDQVEFSTTYGILIISDKTLDRIHMKRVIHENKMEAVGKLAAGIAHEVRNPLGTIRNSTFILHDEIDEKDKLVLKSLNAIDKSVERASRIIENLLSFSRLTTDVITEFKLNMFFEEIIQIFVIQLKKKDVAVDIICSPEIEIVTNRESLKHIVINIIANAIDSIQGKGHISILVDASDDEITVEITDDGCGIDDENISKIFDPFYTNKEIGKGTGLGLYIVHTEVNKINGKISVESKKNMGTTFILKISKG